MPKLALPVSFFSLGLLSLVPLLCFGCAIRGSGVIEEKEYEVEEYSKINLSDGFDGFIYQGESFAVRTNTDDNLTEKIQFEQVGDTVLIRLKDDVSTRKATLEATFIVPSIDQITLRGRSSITATELGTGEELSLELSGESSANIGLPSGEVLASLDIVSQGNSQTVLNLDVTDLSLRSSDGSVNSFRGTCDLAYYQLSSASSLAARSFTSKDAEVDFSSGSSGTISATNTITGTLAGNSRLNLSGGAAVDVEKSNNSDINTN